MMKQLEFKKSLKLLKKYDINFVASCVIKDESAFNKVKYPLVLKVFSGKIIHKSDVGGVIVGIKDKEEAVKAFKKLKKASKNILMQKMVSGKEVIIGMKRDGQFGPVVMFGLGGIFVEVMKDISFRVCPVTKRNAVEMIKEIKSYKILEGIRGEKGININALADLIVNVSKLSLKNDVNEIDLNPVIVDDKKAVVVDVRFMA
ncbi:MAG: acetate--CoA ligase family protein [Nanoarchaeota archaeon]|nr:acetate--CoA ligase family protein [Nanoarchaeota archaeon]